MTHSNDASQRALVGAMSPSRYIRAGFLARGMLHWDLYSIKPHVKEKSQ